MRRTIPILTVLMASACVIPPAGAFAVEPTHLELPPTSMVEALDVVDAIDQQSAPVVVTPEGNSQVEAVGGVTKLAERIIKVAKGEGSLGSRVRAVFSDLGTTVVALAAEVLGLQAIADECF